MSDDVAAIMGFAIRRNDERLCFCLRSCLRSGLAGLEAGDGCGHASPFAAGGETCPFLC